MNEDFDRALGFLLTVEGGKVDDPVDPGGRTAYGITQAKFAAFCSKTGAPPTDVWNIEPGEVEAIYREIWDGEPGLLPWPLSLVHFDATVHHGPAEAADLLRGATWSDQPHDREAFAYLSLRREFMLRLIARKPELDKYRRGWMFRIDRLRAAAGL